jgi:hypothetical protein
VYLLNPLNLPNLLTPSRFYAEIQFGFFGLGFVGLLFYSLYELYYDGDYTIPTITSVSVLIFLVFLFYVLLNRDRLYEEVVDNEIEGLVNTYYDSGSKVTGLDTSIAKQEGWRTQGNDQFNRTELNNLRDQKREAMFEKLQAKRDLKKYDKEYVREFLR